MTEKGNRPECKLTVGAELRVKLHDGRIVDATVRAMVDDGETLQAGSAHEETALLKASQVVD
jgi:hypothetical protein